MAVYAAQVDRMDQGIGRVLDALKKTGREDNTLVMFLADNGGCAEENIGGEAQAKNPVPGGPDSFTSYRRPWANASNTPLRWWKQFTHEGGISSPLIAYWPQGVRERNAITHQPGHVIDLMATCVDLAGARYPKERNGQPITPLEGRSLKPILESRQRTPHEALYWEHQGHRAASIGGYKLVARNGQPWELYDIQADRTELNDLSAKDPARATRMDKAWQSWADKCGVKPFNEVQKAQKGKKTG
jgi:arylsulfatase